jgi:phospholipase/lecithinase/hemolysin
MMHRFICTICLSCVGLVFSLSVCVSAAPFTSFVVFGDSLSDTGNVLSRAFGFYPVAPNYSNGRFTDGLDTTPKTQQPYVGVWHEQLASQLGVPLATRSTGGGTNYAFGGAETGAGTQTLSGVTIDNVGKQVSDYLGLPANKNGLSPSNLYIVWAGGNDLINAAQATGATAQGIAAAETAAIGNLSAEVADLASAGAKNILWVDLPPLDRTPRARTYAADIRDAIGVAATQFRTDWNGDVAALKVRYNTANVNFFQLDVYQEFNDILANPSNFGITDTTNPSQGNAAANPDTYLFWDDLHPTTHTDYLIASEAAAIVVPEPAAITVLLAFLLLQMAHRTSKPFRKSCGRGGN